MLHILVIASFMVIVLHDLWRPAPLANGAAVWSISLGSLAILAACTWAVLAALAADLRRRGSFRTVRLAERMLGASRWLAVGLHALNVLAFGLLDDLRARIGDLIAVDELAVISLPVAVFLVGWWAFEPLERLLRDSTTLRLLDTGRPVFAPPTRAQYVLLNFRHHVLLSLVPIALITAWTETSHAALARLASHAGGPGLLGRVARSIANPDTAAGLGAAVQLLGVAAVFAFSPVLLRRVWDTVRLAPGPLRTRLVALCAASGVRIRELLVWRTHGTMINGAVIGLIGPLRYILLTDALLEHLSARQVEAVMAHEVGHARHRHLPWLAVALLVGVAGAGVLLGLGYDAAAWAAVRTGREPMVRLLNDTHLAEAALTLGSFALGLVWFGFISRRFEWQADAFAVQVLSRTPPPASADDGPTLWDRAPAPAADPAPPTAVTLEAVQAMAGALDAVAELNHLSRQRRSFRHGSIAYRQRRLLAAAGQPLERLRIDRTVRRLKYALGAGLLAIIALMVLGSLPA